MAALAAFKGALGRPIAIGGHRGMGEDLLSIEGASQTVYPAYRENTVLSLQQAASLRGVSFVEFDVQVTRDGVPVIWHDDDVVYGDPASPRSVAVKDLDLQEFQALVQPTAAESAAAANNNINNGAAAAATTNDAADDGKQQLRRRRGTGWRSSLLRAFRSRETRQPVAGYSRWACREDDVLPTLEELFRNLPPQVGFDVEVKMTTGPEVVVTDAAEISRMLDAVISTVERCAAQDASPRPIFYSSFDPDVCKELRRRQSRYGVRFLSGCGLYPHADPRRTSIPSALQFAHENGLHGVVLPASILVANPRMAQEAAAMGLDLMTYGLENNDLDKIMQQCDLGVSAAIVDDVQAVAAAMEAASAASSA